MRGKRFAATVAWVMLVTSCGDAIGIATRHLRIYTLPSGSMENTLKVGDRIVADNRVHVQRGSVVVFTGPKDWQQSGDGSAKFVKRVIGIGGDHVVCCDAQGRIAVNGVALDERYIYPGSKPSEIHFDVTVEPGFLWVLGDHRDASADSRSHVTNGHDGAIPLSSVVGVVVKITSPKERAHPLPTPRYPGLPGG